MESASSTICFSRSCTAPSSSVSTRQGAELASMRPSAGEACISVRVPGQRPSPGSYWNSMFIMPKVASLFSSSLCRTPESTNMNCLRDSVIGWRSTSTSAVPSSTYIISHSECEWSVSSNVVDIMSARS